MDGGNAPREGARMDASVTKMWTEDPEKENPRWTRCRAAIGREPLAYEFIIWNSRCWLEFCKSQGATRDTIRLKLGSHTDVAFDAWQADGVRAGKWQDV